MSDQRIKIPRASDKTLFNCFKELGANFGGESCSIQAFGHTSIGIVSFAEDLPLSMEVLLKKNSTIINTISMALPGLSLVFYRGGNYQPPEKSAIWDEIIFNNNPQTGSLPDESKVEIVALINKKLNAFDPKRTIAGNLSPEQVQLEALHGATLERLEALNEDLIRQSTGFRENLERKFDEKVEKLEADLSAKENALETEFSKEHEQLSQREAALDGKLKEIDNRNNTHVRREIRDRMLDDVKSRIENFGVSRATESKRRPVAVGMFFLIFCLLGLMAFTGYEISIAEKYSMEVFQSISEMGAAAVKNNNNISALIEKAPTTDQAKVYWLWGRFALFSFALLGSILYYIKWQNQWAEQHSNSEFHLQQFYIDVNRANWVIESCLEWRKETSSAIPTDLLKSITNNLFVNEQNDLEKVIHPSDELASALMGSASKLRMKVGDSELDFDKPGKIAKKVAGSG